MLYRSAVQGTASIPAPELEHCHLYLKEIGPTDKRNGTDPPTNIEIRPTCVASQNNTHPPVFFSYACREQYWSAKKQRLHL